MEMVLKGVEPPRFFHACVLRMLRGIKCFTRVTYFGVYKSRRPRGKLDSVGAKPDGRPQSQGRQGSAVGRYGPGPGLLDFVASADAEG